MQPNLLDALRETFRSLFLLALLLLGVLVLGFSGGVRGQSVDKRNDDLLDVHTRVKLCHLRQERRERVQVELIGEHLNDNLHEVLLRDHVLTAHDLLEHGGQNDALVHVDVDALELRQADEICTDKNSQVPSLGFTLLAFSRVALVLQPDPELVHLDEVGQDETDRVLQVTGRPGVSIPPVRCCLPIDVTDGQEIPGLTGQIVPQEQAASRVLHSSRHLKHVLHDLADRGILDRHVH